MLLAKQRISARTRMMLLRRFLQSNMGKCDSPRAISYRSCWGQLCSRPLKSSGKLRRILTAHWLRARRCLVVIAICAAPPPRVSISFIPIARNKLFLCGCLEKKDGVESEALVPTLKLTSRPHQHGVDAVTPVSHGGLND